MKKIFITIYILLVVGWILVPFVIAPFVNEIFEEDATQAQRDIARGTFSLIFEKLDHLDNEGRHAAMEKLRPLFGYPLSLCRLESIVVDGEEQTDLLNGLIVEEENTEKLVQRLGETDWAVTMGGPFPGERLEIKALTIFLLLFSLFLTLPAFAWTLFLSKDLLKIEKMTARFTEGNHSVRVKVSPISSVTIISRAINNMAEKTQKLLVSQKDLTNSVSHEIRTPLARIKFSLEMIADTIQRESKDKDYVAEIGKDVEEIEDLIDELLTYAKFEQEPDVSNRLSKHEMVFWLKSIVKAEQKINIQKKVVFKTEPENEKFVTQFEPVYLRWAVRNLIRNGLKYAKSRVNVVFEASEKVLFIHIDDDGPGIPLRDRQKVFEPFCRLDESRDKKSGGYGLGLAIAKRITDWHKGSIKITLSPYLGARFTISLPLVSKSL